MALKAEILILSQEQLGTHLCQSEPAKHALFRSEKSHLEGSLGYANQIGGEITAWEKV